MKKKRRLFLTSALLVFIFLYFFLLAPLFSLILVAKSLPEKIRPVRAALVKQDFEFLPLELEHFRKTLVIVDRSAERLKIFSVIPFFGAYFADFKNLSAMFLDLTDVSVGLLSSLGDAIPNFNYVRWGSTEDLSGGKGGADLTAFSSFLVKKLPDYKAKMEAINNKLSRLHQDRYPNELRGIKIRSLISEVKLFTAFLANSFDDVVKLVGLMPEVAGENGVKNYLVFLQNDKELRPSGGVLTAYALLTVNKGKLVFVKTAGDVFFLDDKIKVFSPAPDFMSQHLGTKRFYLKDASFSPDFKISAQAISHLWSTIPGNSQVDGVIVLDTHLVASLVDVLGEVNVPNDGHFTSANITDELQKFAALSGSRLEKDKKQKEAVSALLYVLMGQAFSVDTQKRAELFKKVLQEVQEKHLLVYFVNQNVQDLAERYNFTSRIKESGNDYLLISDSNVGGDKSNRYLKQTVKKSLTKEDKKMISTVEINYENTGVFDQVFNRESKNYVRVYVPVGAKLIDSSGSLDKIATGEDLGKTFFAGYLELKPQTKATLTLKYELPESLFTDNHYRLLIQKQPGIDSIKYLVQMGEKKEEFDLLTDKEIEITL